MLKLVFRNIRHHRFTYRYIGGLTVLMTLFVVSGMVLTAGVESGIRTARNRLGADLVILPQTEEEEVTPEEILYSGVPETLILRKELWEQIRETEGVYSCVPRIYLATMPAASCCEGEIQLIATEAEEDFLLQSWTDTADWKDDEIILGYQFRNREGNTIRFFGRSFRIRSVLEKTNTGYDYSGFITRNAAKEILEDGKYRERFGKFGPGDVSALFLNAEDPRTTAGILKSRFGNTVQVFAPDKRLSEYIGTVNLLQGFVWIVSILLAVIDAMSLFVIATIAARSRRNEIGSMMTVGYPKSRIFLLFASEHTIVVMISAAAAAVTASVLYSLLRPALEEGLRLPMNAVPLSGQLLLIAVLLLVHFVIAGLSSCFAVRNVCRTSPAELIKEAV